MKIEFAEKAFLDQVNLGKTDIVRLFLEAGMPPNTKGDHSMTALQFAAIQGHKGVVLALIEAKADVNATDISGKSALGGAAINGHPELIPMLLQAGADINARDDDGNTVLHEFLETPSTAWQPTPTPVMTRTLEALISAKADVNAANEDGITPLMVAATGPRSAMKTREQQENLYVEFAKMLLKAGANVNAREENYEATALMMAASKGYAQIVSALVEGGADLSLKTTEGATAFLLAKNHLEVQKLLNPAEADRSAKPAENPQTTPLSAAQRWAIACGGILARINGDIFDNLATSSTSEKEKEALLLYWGIKDHSSAEETIRWLKTEGHSKDFVETHRLLSTLDNAAYAKVIKDLMESGDERDKMTVVKMDIVRQNSAKAGQRGLTAWDLGRIVNVARSAYTAEYLSSSESWQHILSAARSLQKTYGSWEEMGEHYMIGRRFWNPKVRSDPRAEKALRWLLEDESSPWRKLSWQTPLGSK